MRRKQCEYVICTSCPNCATAFPIPEHGRIEQTQKAIEFINLEGKTLVPVASLSVLMLGPGTSITHEAVKTLADNGCLINWCGEQGVRFYAQGTG